MRRRLATIVMAAAAMAPSARARVFLTLEEALKLAFPGAKVERRTAFLTEEQQKQAQKLAGSEEPPDPLLAYYTATKEDRAVGTAYFDTHVVRTMPETIMVVVDPNGRVARIEVLSFSEPEEYLPRAHWYEQFQGKPLDDELSMKRGVRAVTGATLTARATTAAARRVLALDRVLKEAAAGKTPR